MTNLLKILYYQSKEWNNDCVVANVLFFGNYRLLTLSNKLKYITPPPKNVLKIFFSFSFISFYIEYQSKIIFEKSKIELIFFMYEKASFSAIGSIFRNSLSFYNTDVPAKWVKFDNETCLRNHNFFRILLMCWSMNRYLHWNPKSILTHTKFY